MLNSCTIGGEDCTLSLVRSEDYGKYAKVAKSAVKRKQAKGENDGQFIGDFMQMLKNISSYLASFTLRFGSYVGCIPPSKDLTQSTCVVWVKKVIILEREVDLESLESTFILDVFRNRAWAPLLTSSVAARDILIREFFSNAIVKGDHLNCWVRGKEFTISAMSIQNFLQIRSVILESSLPYDKRTTSILVVVPDLLGEGGGGRQKKQSLHTTSFSPYMRTLAYIMLFNLCPMKNLTTLSQPRALFLHDLYKKKDIDIFAHI
ncbi:hypothetical protein SO802_009503 [Lithocarpus litseifolius]|uniref:Putative plant transposon protein domain-containing protein n=1 Tax=Lithocarpus litseifolius TaxID=425828 RepID=A0AAW2DH68_9ROSI